MIALKYDENLCKTCPTGDCLVKCQYLDVEKKKAVEEMVKIGQGEDSFVLQDCVTCYACEEYCKRGNHPFYLITERREEKGILTSPRAITQQWIHIGEPQGKYRLGDVKERVLSFGFMPEFLQWVKGKLFEDVMPSFIFGQEFFCNVVYIHFANTSIIKERLPKIVDNIRKLGVKEVIFIHDECYAAFAHLAPAYGIEVPFKSVHYFEYLYNRLKELKNLISPLNIRVAYQRPCASRYTPEKDHYVDKILELIGARKPSRSYEGLQSLCCGGSLVIRDWEMSNRVKHQNLEDAKNAGAEIMVTLCPMCFANLKKRAPEHGLALMAISDLCRAALGEVTIAAP